MLRNVYISQCWVAAIIGGKSESETESGKTKVLYNGLKTSKSCKKMSQSKRSKQYFLLSDIDKARYEEKLAVLGVIDDPLSLDAVEFNLTSNIKQWPPVSFAEIFCYLINYPIVYTKSI